MVFHLASKTVRIQEIYFLKSYFAKFFQPKFSSLWRKLIFIGDISPGPSKNNFKKKGGMVSVRELSAVNVIPDFLCSKANPWLLQTYSFWN